MSDDETVFGSLGWADMTLPEARPVAEFYAAVVGWTIEGVDMGGYEDYMMQAADGSSATGICYSRGPNADMPPGWIIYLLVPDLEASLAACREHGGEVLGGVRGGEQSGRFACIRDPAGAVCALYQPPG